MRGLYRRIGEEDSFARRYYCQHARLGYVRSFKKANNKKVRRVSKNLCTVFDK